MEVVLEILEPNHGAVIAGTSSVRLRGRVNSRGHGPLFLKWYSSLRIVSDLDDVPLNRPSDNQLDFVTPLTVGSHVLTLAAKDVAGDALADLQTIQDAGMAGGPEAASNPCIVHVFLAEMVAPEPVGPDPTLSKSGSILKAVAPAKWATGDSGDPVNFTLDPDYHAINRIGYRWGFTPLGPPENRQSANLAPDPAALIFEPGREELDPPVVMYQGPLPGALDTGSYTLTLRVEDTEDNSVGAEVSRRIIIAD